MTETKKTVQKTRKTSKNKRKKNLSRLYTAMNRITVDAVDKEISKRFKTIIDTSDEDLPKIRVDEILKNPEDIKISDYHESLQPYLKHYLFMLKRKKNLEKKNAS